MRKLTYTSILLAAFVLSACTGNLGVQPGDAVVPPQMGDPVFEVVVLAADDLGALPSTVVADGAPLTVPAGEQPTVTWHNVPVELEASAAGFQTFSFTVTDFPDGGRIEVRLEPVVLQGRVRSDSGRPLPRVKVSLGNLSDTTDNEGRYALERATAGTIKLDRAAWEPSEHLWDGDGAEFDMSMSPRIVRAIRVAAEDLLDGERWQTILSLTDRTGVNGLVVDLKTENGTIVYPTAVPTATSIGAVSSYFELAEVVEAAEENDLYLIGRVGVFQDDFFAAAEPERAVLNKDGTLWRPSDPASFEYSIAIAEEACMSGFDEIQFDYVSYPLGGDISAAVFDGEYNQEVRVASISAFLTRAYAVISVQGCAVSSTLLGIVLESSADEGVGQRPGPMSRIVDVLTPTLYSTNYGAGWNNFDNPNDFAVEIVDNALRGGRGKLDGYAYFRPWLQTWTISEEDQLAVQGIVEDNGMGWMLWSNSGSYSLEALPRR